MSVATANTAGHTKKFTANAMLLIGYCLGNSVVPFFFKANQAPSYDLGVGMMFFCVGVQVLCISGIWLLLWKRDAASKQLRRAENATHGKELGLQDVTDLKNPYFEVSAASHEF